MRKKGGWIRWYLRILIALSLFCTVGMIISEGGDMSEYFSGISIIMLPVGMFFILFVYSLQVVIPTLIIYCFVKAIGGWKVSVEYKHKPQNDKKREELIINGRKVDSKVYVQDVVDVIKQSGQQVHVARGSELDAEYRRKTGQTLSDSRCDDCEHLEPWDEPKSDGFFSIFKRRKDSELDDVEEYYRSRGIDHGKKR